jgi:methionyl aminopeptidase
LNSNDKEDHIMTIQTRNDLTALRRIGQIVAITLQAMREALAAGMTTQELDDIGRQVLARYGARSAPELCYGFPGATCISINEEVAHAIPGARTIREGDLVNIDVSAELDGYFADTGASFPVGAAPALTHRLCQATQEALKAAVQVARAGNKLAEVQRAVHRVAHRHRFTVIQNLAGHGIGRQLHEAPAHVPDYSRGQDRRRFQRGMVLTLEPFLSTGATQVQEASDGWTLITPAHYRTAQFEHTVAITDGAPVVLTLPE